MTHAQTTASTPALCLLGALVLSLAGCVSSPVAPAPTQREARRHLHQGQDYMDRGLTASALAAFGLALEENPQLTAAHMGMGDIYRDRGDYRLASHAYQRAAETDPESFDAHYDLALMKQMLGEAKAAVTVYLRALTINPQSPKANRDLASAYLQLGEPEQATPYAKKATNLDPDSQPAWSNLAAAYSLTGQYTKAVDAYRQSAELGPLADPVMLGLADAHIRLGNYARAINTLNTLIHHSHLPAAYERLGYARYKLRHFEQALRDFRKALDRDPKDTSSLNGVGVCLMTLYIEGGRENTYQRDEAIKAWRRSVQLNRDQPRIIDLLSRYSRL